MSDTADAIRSLVACPRFDCLARKNEFCVVRSKRNHPERAKAALREALVQEAETRGLDAKKLGLR